MLKLILLLLLLGVAIYLTIRQLQGGAGASLPKQPKPPTRPVAPDDDVDFLRELDRRRDDDDLS
ncbi:MAG: hypothetical protein QM714_15320 [Nocardioides sp.]|uniref:hypothetical protein n=1 Tax=Nocardioides sp. TaxID=35761 RepID=UPI0039E6036C